MFYSFITQVFKKLNIIIKTMNYTKHPFYASILRRLYRRIIASFEKVEKQGGS